MTERIREPASAPTTLDAGRLRIVFSRTGDRYQHEVQTTGQLSRALLVSLEGGADETWPASPPFQELHVEKRGEGKQVALLVGRAGRSHWSVSIEVDRWQEAMLFDVACRCSGSIDWLGSTYRLPDAAAAVAREARVVSLPQDCRLQVLDGEPHVSDVGQGGVLQIAAGWTVSPSPQTVRWRYRVSPTT